MIALFRVFCQRASARLVGMPSAFSGQWQDAPGGFSVFLIPAERHIIFYTKPPVNRKDMFSGDYSGNPVYPTGAELAFQESRVLTVPREQTNPPPGLLEFPGLAFLAYFIY